MSYLPRSKKRSPLKLVIIWSIFILTVLFILFRLVLPSVDSYLVHKIASPIWSIEQSINSKVSDFIGYFSSKASLREQNQKLTQEIVRARIDLLTSNILEYEISELKEIFERQQEEDIPVAIVSRWGGRSSSQIVIDIGSKHSLSKGDLVFSSERVAIGELSNVFTRSATVRLFSESGREVEGFLIPAEFSVTLHGRGFGGFFFEMSREDIVDIGDLVLLPAFSSTVLAEVVEIDTPEGSAVHKVFARLPVDLSRTSYLFVRPGSSLEVIEEN